MEETALTPAVKCVSALQCVGAMCSVKGVDPDRHPGRREQRLSSRPRTDSQDEGKS